jgi:hypothetical protein
MCRLAILLHVHFCLINDFSLLIKMCISYELRTNNREKGKPRHQNSNRTNINANQKKRKKFSKINIIILSVSRHMQEHINYC